MKTRYVLAFCLAILTVLVTGCPSAVVPVENEPTGSIIISGDLFDTGKLVKGGFGNALRNMASEVNVTLTQPTPGSEGLSYRCSVVNGGYYLVCNGIPVGAYSVDVVISDNYGNRLFEGDSGVEVEAEQISSVTVVLSEPYGGYPFNFIINNLPGVYFAEWGFEKFLFSPYENGQYQSFGFNYSLNHVVQSDGQVLFSINLPHDFTGFNLDIIDYFGDTYDCDVNFVLEDYNWSYFKFGDVIYLDCFQYIPTGGISIDLEFPFKK